MVDEVAREVTQKALAYTVKTTKITGKVLFKICKGSLNFLGTPIKKAVDSHKIAKREEIQAKAREKADAKINPRGKQSVQSLAKKDQGMTTLDLNDKYIKQFDRIMRKNGVDYAVTCDKTKKINPDGTTDKLKNHTLYFKAKDSDAITKAFGEYTDFVMNKENKKSVKKQLEINKEKIKQQKKLAKAKAPKVKTPTPPTR